MSRPLLENLAEIEPRIRAAGSLLLFLDYDGTLTPIVERPELAVLAPPVREVLGALARSPGIKVAIVSGRSLADVRAKIRLPDLIYAGNHGLEIEGPGLSFQLPEAASLRDELRTICGVLGKRLAHIAGIEVENKGLTASVHFRRAAPAAEPEILAIVEATLTPARGRFLFRPGKKVFEIRPKVDWHKGAAVLWIAERVGAGSPLAVYLGDDTTDEDAFRALQTGVTVKVGDPIRTAAAYHVAGSDGVSRFLRWLRDLRAR